MSVDRYQPFRDIAIAQQLDAIALVPGSNFNRLYNQSFHQNERPLLVLIPVTGQPLAVVPNLELGSFALLNFEGEVFDWMDQTGYQSAFDQLMKAADIKSVGVEGQSMRVFVHHAMLAAQPNLAISDAEKAISGLRLIKNDAEIKALEEAVQLTELALAQTLERVSVGMSETEVERLLVQNLFGAGAEDFSFSPIVAAADNSARPHAHARADYQLKRGDALLIDFGGRYHGLCADITRTVFIQTCSDEAKAVYDAVLQANECGHRATRPGATAHDVDDAVISYLEATPYADRIRTKTGHGVGRDIHEDPYIMRGNHMTLEAGMVFTIEPGLYEIDNFGVRIEDDVIVTDDGVRSITTFPKQLTLVG